MDPVINLNQGARAGAANVLGTLCGNIVLFTIGGLGIAWVLTTLAQWFDILRWAGAAKYGVNASLNPSDSP